MDLSLSEGEMSIEDLQRLQKSPVATEGSDTDLDVAAIPNHDDHGLSSRLCPDTGVSTGDISTGEGEDLSSFFSVSWSQMKPATELAFTAEISALLPVTFGEQPSGLELRGDDTPDGLLGSMFRFWKRVFASHQLQGQQIAINILERHTQATVHHFLWWSNSMLLTGAPDFCAAAALFKINFVKPYEKGYVVELVSLLKDKLLCVDCSAKEPAFVLLSPVDARKSSIQQQYRLGPGNSQYKSLYFQHPTTKDLYYWLIEGNAVVLRNKSYVDSNGLEVTIFLTKPKAHECI